MSYTIDPLPIEFRRADWMSDAACRDTDPNDWVTEHSTGMSKQREMCAECPVRQECLDYAMAEPTLKGMWGGLTATERTAIRGAARGGRRGPVPGSKPRKAKCNTSAGYAAHRRRGEDACDLCKQAYAAKRAENRRRR